MDAIVLIDRSLQRYTLLYPSGVSSAICYHLLPALSPLLYRARGWLRYGFPRLWVPLRRARKSSRRSWVAWSRHAAPVMSSAGARWGPRSLPDPGHSHGSSRWMARFYYCLESFSSNLGPIPSEFRLEHPLLFPRPDRLDLVLAACAPLLGPIGSIPPEASGLISLKSINLSFNKLTGEC